jgi:2',3'-cyclic-nucleotide 2'-phosphodiesterase (5'-nucleotidase family)
MTPAQVKKMLERALAKVPESNMAFLQFSGMEVTFDSKQPANARVTEIKVKGKALDVTDAAATLVVAMPAELANGAAGYFTTFNEIQKTRKTLELTLIDVIGKSFTAAKDKTIAPKVDGRLKDLAKKDAK